MGKNQTSFWEKLRYFGKKLDFLGKSPVFWENLDFLGKKS
jgi:hypothetical protein